MKTGVYKLKNGSRIEDVLIMAGGLAIQADRDWVDKNLNRAEKVYDGQKIYIPKVGENVIVSSTPLVRGATVVRLNSASVEELYKLDGVGLGHCSKNY